MTVAPSLVHCFGQTASALFGIEVPIVLGPMAGGPSTPDLVAAVSNAGGLGTFGGGYVNPEGLRQAIRAIRERTTRPFGVNLFAPEELNVDPAQVERAIDVLAPYRVELGLEPQVVPERFGEDFDAQLTVILDERVPIFSVTFGAIPPEAVERLKAAGTITGATVTTVDEARRLDELGVDFVCAQGAEAGGHRGSFLQRPDEDLIGLVALVPQVCDAVGVPVVAAGGMADGRGIAAALVAGACAAQLGTAFLLAPEAGTSGPYRQAVRSAGSSDTVLTAAFSGRRARGIANRFAAELADWPDRPPYPVLNALTRDLRQRAAELGLADFLSLWSGQAVGLVRDLPAAELMGHLVDETEQALAGPAPR